ncbi:hypothetical protein QB788_003478 [Salmonella enterica]|nr:hypothetical protein [Salmonella enterica]
MTGSTTAVLISQAISLIFGLLSAFLWVMSAFAKDKRYPVKTSTGAYSMIGLNKAIEKQSKYNSCAAICASIAILAQITQTFLS